MDEHMARAVALANAVRTRTSPNPWVGSVVVTPDGATSRGRPSRRAGPTPRSSRSSEPVTRVGVDALRPARALRPSGPDPTLHRRHRRGRGRLLVALEDPDPLVSGAGHPDAP